MSLGFLINQNNFYVFHSLESTRFLIKIGGNINVKGWYYIFPLCDVVFFFVWRRGRERIISLDVDLNLIKSNDQQITANETETGSGTSPTSSHVSLTRQFQQGENVIMQSVRGFFF